MSQNSLVLGVKWGARELTNSFSFCEPVSFYFCVFTPWCLRSTISVNRGERRARLTLVQWLILPPPPGSPAACPKSSSISPPFQYDVVERLTGAAFRSLEDSDGANDDGSEEGGDLFGGTGGRGVYAWGGAGESGRKVTG